MIDDNKLEGFFKYLNRVRSKYHDMTLSFSYEIMGPNRIDVYINAEGKFPLPIMTREMFQNLFYTLFIKDSRLFAIDNSKRNVFFVKPYFNGEEVSYGITIDDELSNSIQDFYNEATKKTELTVSRDNSMDNTIKITLINNKITTYIDDEGDIILFTYTYNPSLIKLNGLPISLKSIEYYLEETEQSFDYDVSDIVIAISNLINDESSDRYFTYHDEIFEKFYAMINNSGYRYDLSLSEDIGLFFNVHLRSYQGIDVYGSSDYPSGEDGTTVSDFLGFLEGNRGNYPV